MIHPQAVSAAAPCVRRKARCLLTALAPNTKAPMPSVDIMDASGTAVTGPAPAAIATPGLDSSAAEMNSKFVPSQVASIQPYTPLIPKPSVPLLKNPR